VTRTIASGVQRKCGACGLLGHNRKNKICRMYREELSEAGATNNLAQGPRNRVVRPPRRFQGDEYEFDSGDDHLPTDTDSSDSDDNRMHEQHLDPILEERNRLGNPIIVNNDPYDDGNDIYRKNIIL
jgi:hypothetical protein